MGDESVAERNRRNGKLGGRPKGSSSSYTLSLGALAQRRAAGVKATRKRIRREKEVASEESKQLVQKSREAYQKLSGLKAVDSLVGGDEVLRQVYVDALTSVLESPTVYAAGKVAELEVAVVKSRMKNPDAVITPEELAVTKLSLKAAELRIKAEKELGKSGGANLRVSSQNDDDLVIDAEAYDV